MNKFTRVESRVVPLPRKDIDTDQIIPAQYLTSVSRDGYGENLFRRLRDTDPDFVLDQPQYKDASVLAAGSNFGCGSSREHAVWALTGAGIKVVLAESFADIFTSNSAKNGLLLVVLPAEVMEKVFESAAKKELSATVDLESQTVELENIGTFEFPFDPFRKHCLLNGLDDIDYIKSFETDITTHKTENRKPWRKETTLISGSVK